MTRRPISEATKADRALCPIAVANSLGMKVRVVARAMRSAGVTEALTVRQARAWKSMTQEPPAWMAELQAEAAARSARRVATTHERNLEAEHRAIPREDRVVQRLLAGRNVRGADQELIASDIAFRAMKDLVRADGDTSYLNELDLAALRWAGVTPDDRSTWYLDRGTR